MSKPKKKVDEQLLSQLAGINCTYDEMARILSSQGNKISSKTLRRRYRELVEDGRANGKVSIRRKLFWHALEKNSVPALIHLDKTVNKSSEKIIVEGEVEHVHEHTHTAKEKAPDLSNLSEEELDNLQALLEKAEGGKAEQSEQ